MKLERISMKKIASFLVPLLFAAWLTIGVGIPAKAAACSADTAYAGGDGTIATPYQIATPAQMQYLANQTQADVSNSNGKYFVLTANIDFDGCLYTPPDGGHYFGGYFDGANKTISNYEIVDDREAGLFSVTLGGVIKDLTISGANVSSSGPFAGALVGYALGVNNGASMVIQNIKVVNSTITGSSNYVGGVTGWATWGVDMTKVVVEDSTVTGEGSQVGGALGQFQGEAGSTLSDIRVIDTYVSGLENVGGVVGQVANAMASASKLGFFGGTVARAETGTTESSFGGVIGRLGAAKNFGELSFRGTIDLGSQPSSHVGFLIGNSDSFSVSVTDSYVRGSAKVAPGTTVAGVIGEGSGSISLSRGYVRISVIESGSTSQVSAYPFTVGAASLTTMFYDDELHTSWSATPAGASKTSAEMETYSSFGPLAGWGFSGKASVEAGTASAPWYWDDALEGKLFLSWEYLNKTITPCAPGDYSYNAIGPCDPVPAGNFGAFSGQMSFEPCPAGFFQASTGATECDPAPAGRYVALSGQAAALPCPAGTYQPQTGQMVCIIADPGFFVPAAESLEQLVCPPGTTSQAQATACYAFPQYSGPIVSSLANLNLSAGEVARVSGARMSGITSVSIAGKSAPATCSERQCEFVVPSDVPAGLQDLVVIGSHGSLTVQDGVRILESETIAGLQTLSFTKRISEVEVKFYAKNIVGAGKVQFFLNGEEIAWVRASSADDPKLRNANGSAYLVRTVKLTQGQKNVLEINVDGVRVKRAAYAK